MRLREHEIDLVARFILDRMQKGSYLEMEVGSGEFLDRIKKSIHDDLVVEDNLNREVEDLLKAHMKSVNEGSIDFRKMFAMVKSKLAKERNIILSTGREESDLRLSDDKINHLSHVIFGELEKWDQIEFMQDENDIRLSIKQGIVDGLRLIESVEDKVRKTLLSYSRKIVEGSREWDVMFNKAFEEELSKVRPAKG